MDRRSATPEELPPLELSVLRELELDAPPGPGRAGLFLVAPGPVCLREGRLDA